MKGLGRSLALVVLIGVLLGGLWNVVVPSHAKAAEPYKIGAVFSITGVGSFLGEP